MIGQIHPKKDFGKGRGLFFRPGVLSFGEKYFTEKAQVLRKHGMANK